MPYGVTPMGVLSLPIVGAGGPYNALGGLANDGGLATLASVRSVAGSDSAITVYVRKGSGMGSVDLTGDYHLCTIGASPYGHWSSWGGLATFDGLYQFVFRFRQGNDGSGGVGPSDSIVSGSYDVGTRGFLRLWNHRGCVATGGRFAILGGEKLTGGQEEVFALVRKASSSGDALFHGTYTYVGVAYAGVGDVYYDFTGAILSDGHGHCTLLPTAQSVEGFASTVVPLVGNTYSVSPEGALTLTLASGVSYEGAIDDAGRMGMLGGGSSAGSDPTLMILTRR